MITEDDKYIYIDSKDDLKSLERLKCSDYGSNSNIYKYKNNDILKIFRFANNPSEIEKFKILKNIELTNIALPIKFVFLSNYFYGYCMDYKKGDYIFKIKEDVEYDRFILALTKIQEDIRLLSDNYIEMNDINVLNILYDDINNTLNIVDVDYYVQDKTLNKEKLYIENLIFFQQIILTCLTNVINYQNKKTTFYKHLESIIDKETKEGKNILEVFKIIKLNLESVSNTKIGTIDDMRKILKLHNH